MTPELLAVQESFVRFCAALVFTGVFAAAVVLFDLIIPKEKK